MYNSLQTYRVSGFVVVDDVPEPGYGPDEGVGGGAGRAVGRVGQAVQDDDVAPHEVPVAAVLPAAAHLKKKRGRCYRHGFQIIYVKSNVRASHIHEYIWGKGAILPNFGPKHNNLVPTDLVEIAFYLSIFDWITFGNTGGSEWEIFMTAITERIHNCLPE